MYQKLSYAMCNILCFKCQIYFDMYVCIPVVLQVQTQECQRVMDEAEKEYKKMHDRINAGREAMKVRTPFFSWKYMFLILLMHFLLLSLYPYANLIQFYQASYDDFIAEAQASASRCKFFFSLFYQKLC